MAVQKVEKHSHVKPVVPYNRNVKECHAELQEAVGDQTVARWIQAFRIGGVSTADTCHNECSASVHTDMSVAINE
jgi:hypothetical protein